MKNCYCDCNCALVRLLSLSCNFLCGQLGDLAYIYLFSFMVVFSDLMDIFDCYNDYGHWGGNTYKY